MSPKSSDLAARYASALARHAAGGDEETLAAAYDLGRRALADGCGIMDLVAAHTAAAPSLQIASPAAQQRVDAFLGEALMPFEMGYLGFREANEQLRTLNAQLATQNLDLTRATEAAEAATKELEAFSYSVAHDLRAPLRAIDGFTQALADDLGDRLDDTSRDHVRRVRAAAQRMGELIDALLQLSRITRADLQRRPVDLSVLARAAADGLERMQPEHQVAVKIQPDLNVEADGRLMRVLLENLLGNAWKFTSKAAQPTVALAADIRGAETVYFVRDNGAGFDMRYASRLFNPFQRLHKDAEFPGTGIGLATVRRIVDRHGGRVWAEAEVGRGTTVFFTIPSPDR